MRRSYSTDLSDAEWECLEPHVPPPNKRGRPRAHTTREILDAVFYVLKSGCPWRLLPREFPPWETVYCWFRRWRIDGTWERLNATLRERLRVRLGREVHPSAGIVDSQSAKTTGVGGEQRGYDGGKRVRGRKRHLLVDTEGLRLGHKPRYTRVPGGWQKPRRRRNLRKLLSRRRLEGVLAEQGWECRQVVHPNQQITALGNGVVPLHARTALAALDVVAVVNPPN